MNNEYCEELNGWAMNNIPDKYRGNVKRIIMFLSRSEYKRFVITTNGAAGFHGFVGSVSVKYGPRLNYGRRSLKFL